MSDFATDHPIKILRGRRRLPHARAQKALHERLAWLEEKVGRRIAEGDPVANGPLLDELKALVQLLESERVAQRRAAEPNRHGVAGAVRCLDSPDGEHIFSPDEEYAQKKRLEKPSINCEYCGDLPPRGARHQT